MQLPLAPRPLRYAVVAVVAGVVLYASLVEPPTAGPVPRGPFGLFLLDKWLHSLAYAGVAGTLLYALARADARALVLAVVLASGYGLGIELVQTALPERGFDLADVAANATGAIAVTVCWHALLRRVRLVPVGEVAG